MTGSSPTKSLLMVDSKVCENAAATIRKMGKPQPINNGVVVSAEQMEAAATLLRDGPRTQITSGSPDHTAYELPGFIDAEQQGSVDVLVFNRGVLGSTFHIDRGGTVTEA